MTLLKQARLSAGLTQVQLAKRWGRTQPQVARAENSDIDSLKVSTVRTFLEAAGQTLELSSKVHTDFPDV